MTCWKMFQIAIIRSTLKWLDRMTPCPILHKTEKLATRDNFGNMTSGSGTRHSCLNDGKIVKKIYKSVFKKIMSEVSRCQNTTKTKLF